MTKRLPRISVPNLPQALCRDEDPELFFAEDCLQPDLERIELARSVCAECVERVPCLIWAMANESFGMWGGLTANERKALKKGKTKRIKKVLEHNLLEGTKWNNANGSRNT